MSRCKVSSIKSVNTPLLVINFKTYLEATGKKSVELASVAEHVSVDRGIQMAIAPQFSDIKQVSEATEKIMVFSQHIDAIKPGASTGHVLAEAVRSSGAVGTLLNHSEKRIKISEIEEAIGIAHSSGLLTLVCASSTGVSASTALLGPDLIAVEPPELIGTGVAISKARPELITNTVKKIREVNTSVLILCGAGITSPEDVSKALQLGSQGVLVSSSVVKSQDPQRLLEQMADAALDSQ